MNLVHGARRLETYSVVILPILVVAEQARAPLPAIPVLLAVGATPGGASGTRRTMWA